MTSVELRPEAVTAHQRPDQMASGIRVVEPRLLYLLMTLGVVLLSAVAAGFLIKVPIAIKGTGVILSSKGVLQIVVGAAHEGRISRMLVDIGQHVSPGQEIAHVTQPALEKELALAQGEREQLADETTRVRDLQGRSIALLDNLRSEQEKNARVGLVAVEARLKVLEQMFENMEDFRQRGLATVDRHLQVSAQLIEARERRASRKSELLNIALERSEKAAQFEREMQAIETRMANVDRQINRLKGRIRDETVIRSTEFGIVSEVKVAPGDLVRFDTALVALLPVDSSFSDFRSGSSRLVAAILVPAQDGKRVRQGMRAMVDPTSVRRDVYGAISGDVVRTSDVAASPEELRHIFRNDDLVRKLTAAGPLFVARVELRRDAATETGFEWTTSKGPSGQITAGTLVNAEIETERVALVNLLLPALRHWARGPERTPVQ